MKFLRLMTIGSVIVASLGGAGVSFAQTAPAAEESSVKKVEVSATVNREQLRASAVFPNQTIEAGKPLGPWVSIVPSVPSDPFMLRGPVFSGLRTPPLTVKSAMDEEMESRYIVRRTGGGILMGLSSPFLVTGIYCFGLAADVADRAGVLGFFAGGGLAVLGSLSFLGGLGLFIPGLVLTVTDPSPPGVSANRVRPQVQVRPNGLGFSMSF